MMWTRSELKERGKQAFKKNYIICVVVGIIFSLFVEDRSGININYKEIVNVNGNSVVKAMDQAYQMLFPKCLSTLMIHFSHLGAVMISFMIFVIGILAVIFVFNIIEVGGCQFFLDNAHSRGELGAIVTPFKDSHYFDTVKTMFLRKLYIALWSMLLVIPGIYKSYEYRMIPYIVAEHPEYSDREAFAMSRELMDGEKMNAFLLDLSFIGWAILSSITFGIVGFLYYVPYKCATDAELYRVLKAYRG